MSNSLILFAVDQPFEDTIVSRLIICVVAIAVGGILILTGRQNILTKSAEESGGRRAVNKLFGQSNTYAGRKAVLVGWIRVGCGVCMIIFGIVFLFVGPFLADKPKEKKNAVAVRATLHAKRS